jgi:3-oxoacyl-[acyl-carrier protein] reductase
MSDGALAGKIALITGGGRGMGRAMARAFARAGATGVTVASSASPGELAEAVQEIEEIAGRGTGLAITADVADPAACAAAVARTVERFGALHILVNNAGLGMKNVGDKRGPFWECRTDGWARVIATNVDGPFFMARAAAPHLMAAQWGRILNVSKSAGSMIQGRNSPYGPSKAALDAMTLCWAQDLAGTGVTANVILPGGLTATTFSRPSAVPAARKAGRPVYEPDDIAPLAVALASPASDPYNGCRFNARGWDGSLPIAEALEACRELPIFARPRRIGGLERAWIAPKAPVS